MNAKSFLQAFADQADTSLMMDVCPMNRQTQFAFLALTVLLLIPGPASAQVKPASASERQEPCIATFYGNSVQFTVQDFTGRYILATNFWAYGDQIQVNLSDIDGSGVSVSGNIDVPFSAKTFYGMRQWPNGADRPAVFRLQSPEAVQRTVAANIQISSRSALPYCQLTCATGSRGHGDCSAAGASALTNVVKGGIGTLTIEGACALKKKPTALRPYPLARCSTLMTRVCGLRPDMTFTTRLLPFTGFRSFPPRFPITWTYGTPSLRPTIRFQPSLIRPSRLTLDAKILAVGATVRVAIGGR
jgi:hypothetical protein